MGNLSEPLPGSPRAFLEALIENLIDFLDDVDGDPDAEDGQDEDGCAAEDAPNLGLRYDLHAGDPEDAEDDDGV